MSHNSDVVANRIFEAMVGVDNANLPPIDLYGDLHEIPWEATHAVYQPVQSLDNETLTSGEVNGSGVFDAIMAGLDAHLQKEVKANRITQGKYAEVYVSLTQTAIQAAVHYALGKDQAFWMAARAQAEAISARTQNEVLRLEAMLRRANYALTKLQLATEDAQYGAQEFTTSELLPEQKNLVVEQMEAQRAQTADTRKSDNKEIAGLLAQQKALYRQQVQSYVDDSKLKAAKEFSNLWVTMRTVNEQVQPSVWFTPPTEDNPESPYDAVFKELRTTALGEEDDFVPPPFQGDL